MNTRIYLVAAIVAGQPQAPRLIEAGTAAAARNYATRDMISVKPASPKEVAKLIGTGISLEIASEAPIEQQTLSGLEGGTMQSAAVPEHWNGDGSPREGNSLLGDGTTGGDGLGSSPDLPDANLGAIGASGDDNIVDAEVETAGADASNDTEQAAPRARRRR